METGGRFADVTVLPGFTPFVGCVSVIPLAGSMREKNERMSARWW